MISSILIPLLGGALIGLSASLLLLANGRVAGISGLMSSLLAPVRGDIAWRVLFFGGLLSGGLLLVWLRPVSFAPPASSSTGRVAWLVAAGLLVGLGARLGNGCTSGHGICGISRGSVSSLVATLTFMATAILTVFLVRHIF
ncbi:MAG TPA: YeeE/YedE thiosulfate transporter family protein [Hyalangium sp.]|nr:YeeE/YedE thiosulfate transporter family protein [Hyalangium sp.]